MKGPVCSTHRCVHHDQYIQDAARAFVHEGNRPAPKDILPGLREIWQGLDTQACVIYAVVFLATLFLTVAWEPDVPYDMSIVVALVITTVAHLIFAMFVGWMIQFDRDCECPCECKEEQTNA